MNIEEVLPKVRQIVADVLVLEEDEVEAQSRLISDLGAESIDFLDLVFQLEKEFQIKIPRGQLEKDARGTLTDEEFEQNGVVTDTGMQSLQNYFSELSADNFEKNVKVNEIPTLFTVETFCRVVVKAMTAKTADSEEVVA